MTADGSAQEPPPGSASPATVASWRSLRDAVVDELRAVGLPVSSAWNGVAESEKLSVGVLVDVSTAADGGVQISWRQPAERLDQLAEVLGTGELVEPMMLRYGQVTDVLTRAAALVLGTAGYAVAPSEGPYSTLEYDVLHGPDATASDDCRQ
ncbi:hypothetical protein RM555_05335 [Micromonospora sp. DSM 115977]|uniref:Uncharacterized protein n=1 Tax=Micromonospora reichwaldensis TaxID=3075516 RepID=A0ABU2WR87_9ACTN|nr:hypothetical protein [Micromonospora sp. DSM 115977]MDT0528417.1 hypothetical protein [Micromonospora sp. DSM 115977]